MFTLFEIIHIKDMEKNWNLWELNVNPMRRLCKTHNFNKECRHIVDSKISIRLESVNNN